MEHHWFRKGAYESYDPREWNLRRELPSGVAALAVLVLSFGLIEPCMDTVWYTEPLASRVGDLGIEVSICLSVV